MANGFAPDSSNDVFFQAFQTQKSGHCNIQGELFLRLALVMVTLLKIRLVYRVA